jgi:hypothetical protein
MLTCCRESLKSQVETHLHLAENAKANLLLFKDPQPNSDPPAIPDNPDSQITVSGAPSTATSVIDSPAQSLVPYNQASPNVNESVALSQLALKEGMNEMTCLSECPQELSGILVAQEITMRMAEDLLKISQVPTWTWGSSAAAIPTDQPKHVPSGHRASAPKPADQPTDVPSAHKTSSYKLTGQPNHVASMHRASSPSRLGESEVVNESDHTKPSFEKPSQDQDDVLDYGSQTEYKTSVESLSPLQYLDAEEVSQLNASKSTKTHDLDLQAMIKRMLEETLTARNNRPADQIRADPNAAVQLQKPTITESSFNTEYRDGSERLSKLERIMLAERDEMVRKTALIEAERQAEKTRSEAEKLAKLEQLILAQKEEQLKRDEAIEAVRMANKHAADAKAAAFAAEKTAQAEAAAKLLEAAKKAQQDAEAKAEREEAELRGAIVEELEKATKAAEEAAKFMPSDDPKPPIRFKDAVGRKFSFPWHLCKTWKGMEELIKQAFLHVDILGPHVHEGHYDLVGPDGEIILPQIWETMVKPDLAITMHMWPMPEPPPDKPEKGQKLRTGLSKLFERRFTNQDSGRA